MSIRYSEQQLTEAAIAIQLEAEIDWNPITDEDDFALMEGAIRYPQHIIQKRIAVLNEEITY